MLIRSCIRLLYRKSLPPLDSRLIAWYIFGMNKRFICVIGDTTVLDVYLMLREDGLPAIEAWQRAVECTNDFFA